MLIVSRQLFIINSMSDELYEQLLEEIQDCLPEQRKQFVQSNYQKFIKLQKDNDEVYQQFLGLIDRFSRANSQISLIVNDIEDLKNAKERCGKKLTQVKMVDQATSEIEEVQTEDQLSEMIDNLASFTFEKNYAQAIDSYKLLKEMLQSQKYFKLLRKPHIERQIDQAYKGLSQSLFSDYVNQNPQFEGAQLAEYLMTINQVELLIQAYLEVQTRKFQDWISKLTIYEEKQISVFLSNLLRINQQFEQLFQRYLKQNQLLFAFISNWNSLITQVFFSKVCPTIFEDIYQFEDIFNKAKTMLTAISSKQQKGLCLDFDIQKELVLFIEQKILELFSVYGQKVNQLLHFNQNKLIKTEHMPSLLDCDKLLEIPAVDMRSAIRPQEIKVKSSATIKSTFEALSQPLSPSSVYFWNILFRLGDAALSFFNPSEYPILSTQLNDIIIRLIMLFIEDYHKAVVEVKQSGESSSDQLLFEIGNYYGNFNLCNTLSYYLQNRAALLQFQINQNWKPIIGSWYESLRQSMIAYYRTGILNILPFWICEQGKIYGTEIKQISRPSPLFLMIGFVVCEMKNNLNTLVSKQPQGYFLLSLWDYIKYILEYVLYWSYHNMGKVAEVFFLDKKSREELKLDVSQINLFLQQSSFRISNISNDGMNQLIYDINFVCQLYSRFITPLQDDNFKQKLITLYCKEKKLDITKYPHENQPTIYEQYFTTKFEKDMIQAKSFIEQQRKGVVN